MKKLLTKLILPVIAMLVLALPVVTAAPVQAQGVREGACTGIEFTGAEDCEDEGDDFGQLIRNVINIFSMVVGAISVIMIIIGGFRYIISGGDSNGVTGAKNTIMYAIIGLVIVLFAQIIVRFVFTQSQSEG